MHRHSGSEVLAGLCALMLAIAGPGVHAAAARPRRSAPAQTAPAAPATPATPSNPASPAAQTDPDPWPAAGQVRVSESADHCLDLESTGAPLRDVCEAIARVTRIPFRGPAPGDWRVTCHFRRLPFERALARILRDAPYAIVYDRTPGKGDRVREVDTYPAGSVPGPPLQAPPPSEPVQAAPANAAKDKEGRVPPDAQAVAALKALSERHGNTWVAEWDPKTGLPRAMYGSTGSLGATPKEAAGRFLQQNSALFKISGDLSGLKMTNVLNYGGRARVEFSRTVNGIPVVGSSISMDVDESGAVWDVQAGAPPGSAPPPDQRISSDAATKAAMASGGGEATGSPGGGAAGQSIAELSYVSRNGTMALVWRVTRTSDDDGSTTVVDVDASDGHVIDSHSADE